MDKPVKFTVIENNHFPDGMDRHQLARFLHEKMKPYQDPPKDIEKALDYVFSSEPGKGGFIIIAGMEGKQVGALVMLNTGMKGYVPENLLLFVAVDPELRGRGIGGQLVKKAIDLCDGDVKLHVETNNPAARLYQRIGFTNKYMEMRYQR